jgi:protein tyrosine/serine phosphatase
MRRMMRVIPLEGVGNLRDFGGYPTQCGRGLKGGRFFRAGHQSMATDSDLDALAALGIEVIVDLRRADERERQPSRRWPGFGGQVIESDLADIDRGWEAHLPGADPTPEFFDSMMMDWYRAAPFGPRMTHLYGRFFETMAGCDGGVLIHCAVGKDRTGLLAAMTHHLAGVRREDLVEDYLLTNQALDFEVLLPRIGRLIEKLTGKTPSDEAVRTAMGVRPAYLEAALDAIEARYGSIDAYLEQNLGVDPARRRAFERRHLGA